MAAGRPILEEMRDRLVASLVNGPALNCRPHHSRQRIDVRQLAELTAQDAAALLGDLLGPRGEAKFSFSPTSPQRAGNVGPPADSSDAGVGSSRETPSGGESAPVDATPVDAGPGEAAESAPQPTPGAANSATAAGRRKAALDERALLVRKLRTIIEDARTYAQDTGVDALAIGFPLLSLPPSAARGQSRRVLAPLAFIPVSMEIKAGPTSVAMRLTANGEAIDLVQPNVALLSWLEQQTHRGDKELFADDEGAAPWRELGEIVRHTAGMVGAAVPAAFSSVSPEIERTAADARTGEESGAASAGSGAALAGLTIESAQAASDDEAPRILCAAVLGLYPLANQGLLRDTGAMIEEPELSGPVASFLRAGPTKPDAAAAIGQPASSAARPRRDVSSERSVTSADPCQIRAVRLARDSGSLIVHGPPGTGKSQTITNIVGDHLARGERVLIVCDKRTALDVVANRLEHLGLGRLCGVVHDPRRDQRQFYRNLREQLEGLADAQSRPGAERELNRIDRELQAIHNELTDCFHGVMSAVEPHGLSLHQLIGEWLLAIESRGKAAAGAPSAAVAAAGRLRLEDFERRRAELEELLERAERLQWSEHPWREACGVELQEFLATPMSDWRDQMTRRRSAAAEADRARAADSPPLAPAVPLARQADERLKLADRLESVMAQADPDVRQFWRRQSVQQFADGHQGLLKCRSLSEAAEQPLDWELAAVARSAPPALPVVLEQLAALERYLAIADSWLGVFYRQRRQDARLVLGRYGLALGAEPAARLRAFLHSLRARMLIGDQLAQMMTGAGADAATPTPSAANGAAGDAAGMARRAQLPSFDDRAWVQQWSSHRAVVELIAESLLEAALRPLVQLVQAALDQPDAAARLAAALRQSAAHGAALQELLAQLEASRLFAAEWRSGFELRLIEGEPALPALDALVGAMDDLESVVRVRHGVASLPAALTAATQTALDEGGSAAEGVEDVRGAALAGEIQAALEAAPELRAIDAEQITAKFRRYEALERQKCEVVREVILHRWLARQQERLLASTGSRLNSLGADLKRRLTMRGERAMRLRQVVHLGLAIDGGDPLFDLCPVWMASPETVAQVFPRTALFDIVIFDEASQCRLEEALPVILRGTRLVVAGDPQQLPPSRFFESAATSSDEADPQSEQEWFEMQQRDTGDLLSAALGLALEQCYLDVHYRSRNADLIEFSNDAFYGARLQPIPGHPSRRARYAPLSLYRVDGVYVQRANEREADQVCRIVSDLLKRSEPPSIGVACFNLQQRDLIVEKLDELAGQDADFAARLAAARSRTGDGSFAGLFVKNLENVQGDERDQIIISTTYGPDEQGRFYRRFGPLGQQGGGRRLNVLVTRARQEVHLVTSIPAEVYRSLPPVPPGQTAAGPWLLFDYLRYAERLEQAYEELRTESAEGVDAARSPGPAEAAVRVLREKSASPLAKGLARRLAAQQRLSSQVNWGNEGFTIDIALAHPRRREDATLGLLCDGARYRQADDAVHWDAFRAAVHESQGWTLARVWSPQVFRDLEGALRQLARQADAEAVRQDSHVVDE